MFLNVLQLTLKVLGWQQSHLVFFFMIFKANLLIQIIKINQLCIELLPSFSQLHNSAFVESLVLRGKKLNQLIFDRLI